METETYLFSNLRYRQFIDPRDYLCTYYTVLEFPKLNNTIYYYNIACNTTIILLGDCYISRQQYLYIYVAIHCLQTCSQK